MNPIQDNLPLASIFSLFGFAGVGCLLQSDPLVSSAIGLLGGGLVYATGSLVARVSVQVMPEPQPPAQTDPEAQRPDPPGATAEQAAPDTTDPAGPAASAPDKDPADTPGAPPSPGEGLNLSDVDASAQAGPPPEPRQTQTEPVAMPTDPTPDAPGSLNNPTVPHASNDATLPVDKEPSGE